MTYYICTVCKDQNKGRLRGSTWITFILICMWILPGFIYMAWRRCGPRRCTCCRSFNMIPIDSPQGQRLAFPVERLED